MSEELRGLYDAMREMSKDKKASNIENSIRWLRREGVEHKILNCSNYHTLVIGRIDFWPSTGKWRDRKTGRTGRGVRHVVKLAKETKSDG